MIDTHAHLFLCKTPLDEIVANCAKAGITGIINIATSIATAETCLDIHRQYSFIYPTVGLYPSEFDQIDQVKTVQQMASDSSYVAIGEIGLDYHHHYGTPEKQQALFEAQLGVAQDLGLPVVIHNRNADQDIIRICNTFPSVKKVFHCFSSGMAFVDQVFSATTYFSFTGTITFSKRGKTIQAVRELPLDRVMIETDCPYLTPQPYIGKENSPAYVGAIAQKIAQVKSVSIDEVQSQTTRTASTFFNIEVDPDVSSDRP